jgi:M6 family metalloprotease-like protein
MGSRRSIGRYALIVFPLLILVVVGVVFQTRGRKVEPPKRREPAQTRPLIALILRCPGPTVSRGGEWRTKQVKVEKPIPDGSATGIESELVFPGEGDVPGIRAFGGDVQVAITHPRHADLKILVRALSRDGDDPLATLVLWDGPASSRGMTRSEADHLEANPIVRIDSLLTTPGATRWRLNVTDATEGSSGTLDTWQLKFVVARVPFEHEPSYYRQLLFGDQGSRDPIRLPNVVDYFREVSRDKFTFRKAGVHGPVAWEGWDGSSKAEKCAAAVRLLEMQGVDLRPFDANHDGLIDVFELTVVVFHNERDVGIGWASTDPNGTMLERSGLRAAPGVCFVPHRVDFETLTHEVSHALTNKVFDLYGVNAGRSSGLTLMSETLGNPADDKKSLYFDVWHRVKLGWIAGTFSPDEKYESDQIELGSEMNVDAEGIQPSPLLIRKPGSDGCEYYLFEYRDGWSYDNGVGDQGVVAWHVREDRNGNPFVPEGEPSIPGDSIFAVGPDSARGARRAWKPSDGSFRLHWSDGTLLPQSFRVEALRSGTHSAVLKFSSKTGSDSARP